MFFHFDKNMPTFTNSDLSMVNVGYACQIFSI
jgi:hypothetical protein